MSSLVIPDDLSTITYAVRDHVAHVTLNRPEVHNAFNERMQDELAGLWRQIRADEEVRVVVLTGAGEQAFCTGIDRGDIPTDEDFDPFTYDDPGRKIGPKSQGLWKPVIAAVNGIACGGGFYLLGECDIIIAAASATFFDPHVTYGMTAVYEPILLTGRMAFGDLVRMSLVGVHEPCRRRRPVRQDWCVRSWRRRTSSKPVVRSQRSSRHNRRRACRRRCGPCRRRGAFRRSKLLAWGMSSFSSARARALQEGQDLLPSRSEETGRSGSRRPLPRRRQTRAQLLLEDLAHRVPGQRVDDFELLGALLDREALEAAVLADVGQLHLASFSQNDDGDDALSRARVGHSEHGRFRDVGMAVEQLLDLDDRDVLGVADDDVLDATRDADVAVHIDRPEVPGVEPSVGIDRILVERRVDVTGEALGTLKLELTLPPGAAHVAPRVHGAHRDTRRRTTDGRRDDLGGVGWCRRRGVRELREAPAPHKRHINIARISSWISVGTGAPPKQPNRREGKSGWSSAAVGSVQVGPEKRDGGAEHRRLVQRHPAWRRRGVEGLEEDEVDATAEACGKDRRAADVGDRPGDRIDVLFAQSHQVEQGVRRGHDAGVGMAGALGVGRGARRVVDPTGAVE